MFFWIPNPNTKTNKTDKCSSLSKQLQPKQRTLFSPNTPRFCKEVLIMNDFTIVSTTLYIPVRIWILQACVCCCHPWVVANRRFSWIVKRYIPVATPYSSSLLERVHRHYNLQILPSWQSRFLDRFF